MGKLYKSHKILYHYGRPIHIVEVIKQDSKTVTFKTDYPVETITCAREHFDNNFHKW